MPKNCLNKKEKNFFTEEQRITLDNKTKKSNNNTNNIKNSQILSNLELELIFDLQFGAPNVKKKESCLTKNEKFKNNKKRNQKKKTTNIKFDNQNKTLKKNIKKNTDFNKKILNKDVNKTTKITKNTTKNISILKNENTNKKDFYDMILQSNALQQPKINIKNKITNLQNFFINNTNNTNNNNEIQNKIQNELINNDQINNVINSSIENTKVENLENNENIDIIQNYVTRLLKKIYCFIGKKTKHTVDFMLDEKNHISKISYIPKKPALSFKIHIEKILESEVAPPCLINEKLSISI